MSENREWMYKRYSRGGIIDPKFLEGLETFIRSALSQPRFRDGDMIKCPCAKCDNVPFRNQWIIRTHLCKYGFVRNYKIWRYHGETLASSSNSTTLVRGNESTTFHTMIMDVAGPDVDMNNPEEPPNSEAQKLYDMLKAADTELWPGCKAHTQMSFAARLMNLKSENHMSEKCYNQICDLMREIVPENNLVTENFYSTKKLLRGLGLPVEKIDCCIRSCMIYWGADRDLVECKFCGHPRFKNVRQGQKKAQSYKRMHYFPITPRLQRLYASNATAKHMSWHAKTVDDGVMRHPADTPAWKHFNGTYPQFASKKFSF